MGEKPTGTSQEPDDEEDATEKAAGASKAGSGPAAGDAGRTAGGIITTRSNIGGGSGK